MAVLVPLAATGIIDPITWLITLAAFVVAGGVVAFCWAEEDARERERQTEAIRRELENG